MTWGRHKAVFAWWGALENGGETIGDLYALCRVVRWLAPLFQSVSIASNVPYAELVELGHPVRPMEEIEAAGNSALIFVCGPMIKGSTSFQEMMARFSGCRTFAIGVTRLPQTSPDHWDPFDVAVYRDGGQGPVGDLAFAPGFAELVHPQDGLVGICLRGSQVEYGENVCLHENASELARIAIQNAKQGHVLLDTRLHGSIDGAQAIIRQFQQCSVIVTSRLHGTLLSIALGIPVFAIDQIRGGNKVMVTCNQVSWAAVWPADLEPAREVFANWQAHLPDLRANLATAQARMHGNLAHARIQVLRCLEGAND